MENNDQNINVINTEVSVTNPVTPTPVPEVTVEPTPVVETPVTPEVTPVVEPTQVVAPAPVVETPVMPEVTVEPAPVAESTPIIETTPVVAPSAVELSPIEPVSVVEAVEVAEPTGLDVTNTPVDGTASIATADGEIKKSKKGLIILILIFAIIIVVALYILLTHKEDPNEEKPEEPTPVETKDLYYKQEVDEKTYELILYKDGKYIIYFDETMPTEEGTYTLDNNTYTLKGTKQYIGNSCYNTVDVQYTLALDENGTLTGFLNDTELNFKSTNEVTKITEFNNNHTEITCEELNNPTEVVDEPTEEPTEVVDEPTETDIEVNKITLDITKKTVKVGEKVTLKATIDPKDATNKTITWTSSDSKVATVKDGVVTTLKEGKVTITAKSANNKTATATITIEKKEEPVATTCKYGDATFDLTEVRTEGTSAYQKFKKIVNTAGEDTGKVSAENCKSLKNIISEVQTAVKNVAKVCWDDKMTNNAAEAAKCKLTPGCDKTSTIGPDAKFNLDKQDLVIAVWNAHHCDLTYTLD